MLKHNIRAGHKNGIEYLECTQNAVNIFRMHFEYPGMYNEFPFLRHSGSFGLYYDGGINAAGIEIFLLNHMTSFYWMKQYI